MTVDNDGSYSGILKRTDLFSPGVTTDHTIKDILKPVHFFLKNNDSLRTAVEIMAKHNTEALPVIAAKGGKIMGMLTYPDVLTAYKHHIEENETANTQISLKRRRMKMLIRGKKLIHINDVSK
jgi:predicted transcriptional regulator